MKYLFIFLIFTFTLLFLALILNLFGFSQTIGQLIFFSLLIVVGFYIFEAGFKNHED